MAGSPAIVVSSSLSGLPSCAFDLVTRLSIPNLLNQNELAPFAQLPLGLPCRLERGKGGKRKDERDGVALAPSNCPPGR
jgi:hypothetical protein